MSSIVRLLRFASIAICLIVIVSFAIFAIEQTSTASSHQQESLATGGGQAAQPVAATHEGTAHKVIDEAANSLTSPFAGIVSATSEWANRGVKLLLALVVYGFGLGFLARTLRVHA